MKEKVNLSHCSTLAIWLTDQSSPPPVMYLFEVFLFLGSWVRGFTTKKNVEFQQKIMQTTTPTKVMPVSCSLNA